MGSNLKLMHILLQNYYRIMTILLS